MTLGERLAWLNRVQRARSFKIGATIVVVLLSIVTFVTYVVAQTAPADGLRSNQFQMPTEAEIEELSDQQRTALSAIQSGQQAVNEVLRARYDWKSVAFGLAALSALALTVIWIGLGLTYLALLAAGGLIAYPLSLFGPTRMIGTLLLGIIALTASFTALLQLLRILLDRSHPVFSIARVVLDEAVRMKISLVFIVILIIGLAALPNALDAEQPLRYRVQSFMSFSTGLSFWTIAVLTILFSAATVTFEQRDKIIWQTMTKPVSAWSYLLGKWLGVGALSAVLLAVCASGIFLFVEHLRGQPALGEREAYVSMGGEDLTEDRWILETQILSSRKTVQPTSPLDKGSDEFQAAAQNFIDLNREQDPNFAIDPGQRRAVVDDLFKSWEMAYRSIEPGNSERYVFKGLAGARESGALLTFRHRIDAGTNRPDEFFPVTFLFDGDQMIIQERMSPGYFHSVQVFPTAVADISDRDLAEIVDPEQRRLLGELDGAVALTVINGNLRDQTFGGETISFPPGGLELSYAVGSYRLNFLRAMVVLWIKLLFLAVLAIWASTFLSFPVASLVAFGAFLAAEGSGFLAQSLDVFATTDQQGNVLILSTIAAEVTRAVSWVFSLYGDLDPTQRIVQGKLISVGDVMVGGASLVAASAAMYVGAVLTFRRRELATYSGR